MSRLGGLAAGCLCLASPCAAAEPAVAPSPAVAPEPDRQPPPEPSLQSTPGGSGLAVRPDGFGFKSARDLQGLFNVVAGRTHRVDALRSFFGLSGAGVLVGVFEVQGRVLADHEAFGDRVTLGDAYPTPSAHATHVAGTVAADPPATGDPRKLLARGMAPAARVVAYEAGAGFEQEMTGADAAMVASNHSYGPVIAWEGAHPSRCAAATNPPTPKPAECASWNGITIDVEDRDFGKYTAASRLFDRLARQRERTTMFIAAGNDRNDAPPAPFTGWHIDGGQWRDAAHRFADGWDRGGYDTVAGGQASAKNTVTIGAIVDVEDGITPARIAPAAFSGWGPTDDGRIKPDLVANGLWLYSTSYRDNAGTPDRAFYQQMPGTSMAAPVATGVAALLNELARRERGSTLTSDELKAVLIHTAVSPTPGPNYRTGWGAIDAMEAGNVVAGRLRGSSLRRERLGTSPFEQRLTGRARTGVKVTLVWLDPPALANTGGVDEASTALVNDLDLELVAPDGTVHAPWALDPAEPANPARRCAYTAQAPACPANRRDTVEQIDVAAAEVAAGRWTVRVRGPTAAQGQTFALVVSGLD